MAATDYLIVLQSPNAQTTLTDPLGPGDNFGSPGWRSIELSPRYNEPGTGTFTAVATPALISAATTPEARVVVIREPDDEAAVIEMAGPIENVKLGYEAARDGTDGFGTLTVQFTDDLASIAYRLVYPTPTAPATAQTATKYAVTGNAEDIAQTMVNVNCAAGALAPRRYPEIIFGSDNGVGGNISTSFLRSVTLTEALREVLRLGGNLGMRTVQGAVDNLVRFQVYQPRNLTADVWFSRALGNIRSLEFEFAAPTATVAIVGNDQAGTARVVKERSNTAALTAGWRRKEIWVDGRSAANATELEQAGDEALADTGPTVRVSVVAIETPMQRYRTHVGIGDRVSIEPFDGFVITDIVRGVDITVNAETGEKITFLIGAEGDGDIDLKAVEITRLKKRLARIEGAL